MRGARSLGTMSWSLFATGATALVVLFQAGCCAGAVPPSTTVVGSGEKGVYARAIPPDVTAAVRARAGLVELPERWPPAKLVHEERCEKGLDELKELESSLGSSLAPTTCPQIQIQDVPTTGTPTTGTPATGTPDPDADLPPAAPGFMPHCYQVGNLVLVVEALEGFDCKHVVGLALFKKKVEP